MWCRESIFVEKSTIDFPFLLPFFNTKFPSFSSFFNPEFPIFLIIWATMPLDTLRLIKITFRTALERESDVQKEIVRVLQGSAADFSRALVRGDELPTKEIRECGVKKKFTVQFNSSNCSVLPV